MPDHRTQSLPFKPRARLLLLLGDQLIRDPGIAAFELVKNAYDADASQATVTMIDLEDIKRAKIVVEDDGTGMDWNTVTQIWLEPGTDYRSEQRRDEKRTKRFKRLPLGEKGVGRFAAHKLGQKIQLVTRTKDSPETVVDIDWTSFEKQRYLSDVNVSVKERPPEHFLGKKTGTRIEIKSLRDKWTRGMARELHRQITAICSPFENQEDFKPRLVIEPDNGWLHNLLDVSQVLRYALFNASCILEGRNLSYSYRFRPFEQMEEVEGRRKTTEMALAVGLNGAEGDPLDIGIVKLDLHIFDLEPQTLRFGVSDKKGLKEFLNLNGGIRVYRDGIRVYDYGEPENDWLELGGRRVNVPGERISNNLVIGAVSLSLKSSSGLIEKTNREGFVENEAYRRFRKAVLFAVKQIEAERNQDKTRIRNAYRRPKQKEPVLEDLAILREKLIEHKLDRELGGYVDSIESQFREVRDRLLTAAGAGLSLAMVIHEVEKGIEELNKAVERSTATDRIRSLAHHLHELIEGLTYLTRKSGQKNEKANILIQQAIFNTEFRARYHNIKVINGIDEGDPDFTVKCTRRLIIATLMNLIDNSIWWLDNKGGREKNIYIGTSPDYRGGPAIIVADNGPGFQDPPEYLVQPFITRKPDGMGLGLHLANEIMKVHGGSLEFPEEGDVELPEGIDGAAVALVFKDQPR